MAYNLHCFNHLDAEGRHRACDQCNSKGDCQSMVEEVVCPFNNALLKIMGETSVAAVGVKMTKQQVKADRTKRSRTHFKKEILPYLPPSDQKDFAKKGKKPL